MFSKPAFTPTRSSGGGSGFNPLGGSRQRGGEARDGNVDEDGWGQDAPPVTRTQLEKVPSSYQPTKVNFKELTSQKPEPSRFNGNRESDRGGQTDVVKGDYQPVGKVDIAALRRQAQGSGSASADRPEIVKGSYEPVGKVDIAAIRARAQRPSDGVQSSSPTMPAAASGDSTQSTDGEARPKSLTDRSAPFTSSERMTSIPKPKVSNRFGSSTSTFTGTKAPTPGGFGLESKPKSTPAPVGAASRTFADQGGKTPAQQWAEKKARERGLSGAGDKPPSAGFGGPSSPIASQSSGGGEWKSGYAGKSWAPVATTHTGKSASSSIGQERTGQDKDLQQEAPTSPAAGIGAIRNRFKDAPPMGASATGANRSAPSPPPLDTSTKPNAGRGIPIPGLPTRPNQRPHDEDEDDEEHHEAPGLPTPPPQPPRSPTPPTPPAMRSGSPIRVAMPVGRGHGPEIESAREEQFSPPPMPIRSLAAAVPHEEDLTDEPEGHDPARATAAATAATSFGQHAADTADPGAAVSGKRALVQYDYEKAEDNEIELREGEYVTNIEMVDEDWWAGQNAQGETGLFPSNYVELVEDEDEKHEHAHQHDEHEPEHEQHAAGHAHKDDAASQGPTATALYDYEAAEDNELSFPEGAKITGVVSALPGPWTPQRFISANLCRSRTSRTKTGGWVSTTASRASFLRTTSS